MSVTPSWCEANREWNVRCMKPNSNQKKCSDFLRDSYGMDREAKYWRVETEELSPLLIGTSCTNSFIRRNLCGHRRHQVCTYFQNLNMRCDESNLELYMGDVILFFQNALQDSHDLSLVYETWKTIYTDGYVISAHECDDSLASGTVHMFAFLRLCMYHNSKCFKELWLLLAGPHRHNSTMSTYVSFLYILNDNTCKKEKIGITTCLQKEKDECSICLDAHPNVMFLPCKHKTVCKTCWEQQNLETCCLCREVIMSVTDSTRKTYKNKRKKKNQSVKRMLQKKSNEKLVLSVFAAWESGGKIYVEGMKCIELGNPLSRNETHE